jgi:hypothetical protein
MTREQLEQMRGCVTDPKIDAKTVKFTCNDGDILERLIEFVDIRMSGKRVLWPKV